MVEALGEEFRVYLVSSDRSSAFRPQSASRFRRSIDQVLQGRHIKGCGLARRRVNYGHVADDRGSLWRHQHKLHEQLELKFLRYRRQSQVPLLAGAEDVGLEVQKPA